MSFGDRDAAVAYLRSTRAVRRRCSNVLEAVVDGRSDHFRVDLSRLDVAAELTLAETRRNYPELRVPLHGRVNHFRAAGRDRLAELEPRLGRGVDRGRRLADLIVVSVLLDAGAGARWGYAEPGGGPRLQRSEGLAVASLRAFEAGLFSSDPADPLRVDAEGLGRLSEDALGRAFQVSERNPLVGVAGRLRLLRRLGETLTRRGDDFAGLSRPGGLCDVLASRSRSGRLSAELVLSFVLESLSTIWPSRTQLDGVELGDVWPHRLAGGQGPSAGLVPLHKLSQWLSYSLVHPLAAAGVQVTALDGLTGLAEYRNGGLFVDCGVIVPRNAAATTQRHDPASELIVEWRALTVALLDRLAPRVRERCGLDAEALPLGSILEGGTWAAGRRLAAERRELGAPPIAVESDGTLF